MDAYKCVYPSLQLVFPIFLITHNTRSTKLEDAEGNTVLVPVADTCLELYCILLWCLQTYSESFSLRVVWGSFVLRKQRESKQTNWNLWCAGSAPLRANDLKRMLSLVKEKKFSVPLERLSTKLCCHACITHYEGWQEGAHHALCTEKKKTDVYHNGRACSAQSQLWSQLHLLCVKINTIHTNQQPGPPDRMNQHKSKRLSETTVCGLKT